MGERTRPCETPDLNCRFVDVWFLNVVYAMRPLMKFAMYLSMVCGMFVCLSLSINVCIFTGVKRFAHVWCYCDGAYGWNGLVETCCDSVVDVVECCVCGVLGFEPVLCCDVWYVMCYVWDNHLLGCLCNNR